MIGFAKLQHFRNKKILIAKQVAIRIFTFKLMQ